jgi:hypothetical protein
MEAAGAVSFEAEAVVEGPEDRLDALADPGERGAAAGLVLACGSEDPCAEALPTWASKSRPA